MVSGDLQSNHHDLVADSLIYVPTDLVTLLLECGVSTS
jgi:hypothetical protein